MKNQLKLMFPKKFVFQSRKELKHLNTVIRKVDDNREEGNKGFGMISRPVQSKGLL